MKTLRVSLISYGKPQKHTERSLAKLMATEIPGWKLEFKPVFGSLYLHEARNDAVNGGKNCLVNQKIKGFDKILMVDHDMEFEPEDIITMLNSDCEVVSALYPYRDTPDMYVAGVWGQNKEGKAIPGYIVREKCALKNDGKDEYFSDCPYVVDWIGTGLHMVDKKVYEKLPYPWYRHTMVEVDGLQKHSGEDIGFCQLCGEAGTKVYVEPKVKVKHYITEEPQNNVATGEQPKETLAQLMNNMLLDQLDQCGKISRQYRIMEQMSAQIVNLNTQLAQLKKDK